MRSICLDLWHDAQPTETSGNIYLRKSTYEMLKHLPNENLQMLFSLFKIEKLL